MGAIKATVFLDKLHFSNPRCSFRILLSTRPEQEQEAKKERVQAGERQAEKVLRTTAGTVALLPFDLRSKTRRRVRTGFPST